MPPPTPFTLNIPIKDAAGNITGYTSGTNEALLKQGTVIPGERAVISSITGADTFNSKVQPNINAANATVEATRVRRATDARDAALAATAKGETIPQDVLDELNAAKTPEERASAAQLASWNKQMADAKAVNDSLTLSAKATAASNIAALTGQWNERKGLLEKSNSAVVANWNQQFLRTGQAEYSPGMTGVFITGKEQEGISKVKALDDEYTAKIAAINSAVETKNFERAAALTKDLSAIEDKALAAMQENAKSAAAINKKMKDALVQTQQEITVSGLFNNGLTSASDIQAYLHAIDEDMSLENINKILKIVNPNVSLAGTKPDYQTFRALQAAKDPSIEGMSYLEFVRAVTISRSKSKGETGEGGTTFMSFEEWKVTDSAKNILTDEENRIQANMIPEAQDKFLRTVYDQAVQKTQGDTPLTNLTPTNKRDLALAGLSGADALMQKFFLATSAAFRQSIQREAATGAAPATIDELAEKYDEWAKKKNTSDGTSAGDTEMTDAEFLAELDKLGT